MRSFLNNVFFVLQKCQNEVNAARKGPYAVLETFRPLNKDYLYTPLQSTASYWKLFKILSYLIFDIFKEGCPSTELIYKGPSN